MDPNRILLGGGTGGLKLAIGEPLVLPLDTEWLRSRWPERFQDMSAVYLYFKADGYTAIRSEKFLWIGSHGPPFGPRVNEAEITFIGRKPVIVTEGQSAEIEVVFRRPKERFLRLIDDEGKPVPGVKISSYMYWSDENHCGGLSGADPIGSSESDQDGRVAIPDGDFQYAFVFEKRLYVLNEPDAWPYLPPRLITYLSKPETTLKMRRWQQRPLEMVVTANAKPAAGLIVGGCLAGCSCGACCGQLAQRSLDKTTRTKTDGNGKFQMTDFYPEEFERVYLLSAEDKEIWAEDPRKWPSTGVIHVELKK